MTTFPTQQQAFAPHAPAPRVGVPTHGLRGDAVARAVVIALAVLLGAFGNLAATVLWRAIPLALLGLAYAGLVLYREARPLPPHVLRIGGYGVRLGKTSTGGRGNRLVLEAVGLFLGGFALWALTALLSRDVSGHAPGIGEAVFAIGFLAVFIVPGLILRPIAEVDLRTGRVRRFLINGSIPLALSAPARFSVQRERHATRYGGFTPHLLTAVLYDGRAAVARFSLDSLPSETSNDQVTAYVEEWQRVLNPPAAQMQTQG